MFSSLTSSPRQAAPDVVAEGKKQVVAIFDPTTKQLNHNPKFEELFQPEVCSSFSLSVVSEDYEYGSVVSGWSVESVQDRSSEGSEEHAHWLR